MATRISHYDQGDVWTPQATFTVSGVETDPTEITVRVKDPDGAITVLGPVDGATGGGGITRVSAGVFKTDIQLDDAGYWFARFEGTGTAAATHETQAIVDPSEFYEDAQLSSRALVSLAEAKDWLQQQNIDTTGDLELARVINDISDLFHAEAEREFKVVGTNPQTRIFRVDGDGVRNGIVSVGDLQSVTSLEVLSNDWSTVRETVASGDYALLPRTRESWQPARQIQLNHRNGVGWLRGDYLVRVTGSFGFPSVPGRVRQAVLDEIAVVRDRDVEHYRLDLGGVGDQAGTTVVQVGGGRQRILSMSPKALAVAWSFRSPLVG